MKTSCAFYFTVKVGKRKEACSILTTKDCENCKFYKKKEDYNIYQVKDAQYKYAHRDRRLK